MKTQQPPSPASCTPTRDYDAAKEEPDRAHPAGLGQLARAALRLAGTPASSARSSARSTPDDCAKIDTGGYRVITTLDWTMQRKTEKWVYAAARAPNAKDVTRRGPTSSVRRSRPAPMTGCSACAARTSTTPRPLSSTTGPARSSPTSAAPTTGRRARKKFQPQFDVLADGWRQPGSSIKPIDYAIGIEDQTMTAATMFMDVVTDFGGELRPDPGRQDGAWPRPAPLCAPVLAQHARHQGSPDHGLDHVFERDQGLRPQVPGVGGARARRWASARSRSTRSTWLSAYGTTGERRRPDAAPRPSREVVDDNGIQVWPVEGDDRSEGSRVISRQAAYIITDILAGNTHMKVNPYWGKWAIYDGEHPPPRRLQDRHDERQQGRRTHTGTSRRRRTRTHRRSRSASGWATATTPAERRHAVARPVRAALVGDHDRRQQGPADRQVQAPPKGVVTAEVDAFTGTAPGPFTPQDRHRELHRRHRAHEATTPPGSALAIDAATGLRWQDGCAGPKVVRGLHGPVRGRSRLPGLAEGQSRLGRPRRTWRRCPWRAEGHRTSYFYDGAFAPFGRTWGVQFAPSGLCPIAPVVPPPCDPLTTECATPAASPARRDEEARQDAEARLTRGRARARRSSRRPRLRRARRDASTSRAGGSLPRCAPHPAARPFPCRG